MFVLLNEIEAFADNVHGCGELHAVFVFEPTPMDGDGNGNRDENGKGDGNANEMMVMHTCKAMFSSRAVSRSSTCFICSCT